MSDNRHCHAMEIAYGMACEQTKPLEKAAEKLHPAPAGELVERLRKQAVCIYIAVERSMAEDIADGLNQAAARIAALEAEKRGLVEALELVESARPIGGSFHGPSLHEALSILEEVRTVARAALARASKED